MRLLLMRHGHAESRDHDPALAAHGVAAVRATLERPWPAPALLVHSPLLRARQTAALCAERWPAARRLEDAAFVPGHHADAAGPRLLELAAGCGMVLLVSHLPLLPALCDWLCDERLDFEPADAVLLEAEDDVAWQGAFTRVVT
ncbi:MAG: histidine phosphatase family protein [Pseudomonadales bacterium]|jgi:phosphohistidine phosphatase SixA|nr:histidine phosphatase family protein [Pseudomonadales bacterium]